MPGTIDDFMNRFNGNDTVTDADAQRYQQRSMPRGNQGFQPYNQPNTEYLGKLRDDQFQQQASEVISQAPPQERAGLLGSIMGALGGNAGSGGLGQIAKMLGLGTTDPSRMSNDEAARVMNYARTQRPDVLQRAAQEKPWFTKALGNPVVMGALTMMAARMFNKRRMR